MSNIGIVGSKLNAEGGIVTQGKLFCKVQGRAVAHVGSKGTTHLCLPGEGGIGTGGGYAGPGDTVEPPPADSDDTSGELPCLHLEGQWVVSKGSSFVKVEGIPVAKVGSLCSCKHVVTTGEFVKING